MLEIQIERQRAGKMEREQHRIGGGEILFCPSDGHKFGVQLHRARGVLPRRSSGFVLNHENFGAQERTLPVDAQEFETLAALGDQVEAAVGVLFHDGNDFGGTSHLGETLFDGAHDPEDASLGEAFADHFLVVRFEDMQGQGSAGKQDDIEREQWQKGVQAVSGDERGDEREHERWLDCTAGLDFTSCRE